MIDLDKIVTIDIETIKRKDIDLLQIEAEIISKNMDKYKKQSTIDEHVKEDMEKYMKNLALNKFTNRIITIGCMNNRLKQSKVFYSENEKEVLEDLIDFLNEMFMLNDGVILAGHNFREFDLTQITYKVAKHNVNVNRPIFPDKKWDTVDSLDLIGGEGKLDELLKDMGIPMKYNGYSGKDVEMLYETGQIEELLKYQARDVESEHIAIMRLLKARGYKSKQFIKEEDKI